MSELAEKLAHRNAVNAGEAEKRMVNQRSGNIYVEFGDVLTRKQIKFYNKKFSEYDDDKDGKLEQFELQRMMEKLDVPCTALTLRALIREVDQDSDGKVSYREFLSIFQKNKENQLSANLAAFANDLTSKLEDLEEINVSDVGVGVAKNFFEAKVQKVNRTNAFEQGIKKEQEELRQAAEDKKKRQAAFKARLAEFGN